MITSAQLRSTLLGHTSRPSRPNRLPPKPRTTTIITNASFNVNKALDKSHEKKLLKDIIALPPSALQGLTPEADAALALLKINTVKDLGSWKFYQAAKAMLKLAPIEEAGADTSGHVANINKILKKDYEVKTLKELLGAPIAAFQGLTPARVSTTLERLGLHTIQDLAEWKYAAWAESITALSKFENSDASSR